MGQTVRYCYLLHCANWEFQTGNLQFYGFMELSSFFSLTTNSYQFFVRRAILRRISTRRIFRCDFAAKLVVDFHGIPLWVLRLCEIFRCEKVELFPTSGDFAAKAKIYTAHVSIHCRAGLRNRGEIRS